MKNIRKDIFLIIAFIAILSLIIVLSSSFNKEDVVYAASSGTSDIQLLARAINGEARGEPYIGQVAVGAVIMNRVKSASFPNTIAGVIYQKGQFSSVTDGQFDVEIDEDTTVYKAAQDAMNGVDPTNGALYFYNPSKTKSKWLFSLKTVTTIGKHVFALEE